jgi:hypothetical protein
MESKDFLWVKVNKYRRQNDQMGGELIPHSFFDKCDFKIVFLLMSRLVFFAQ